MIENYLHTSGDLKAVFLLVDIRHEPSANDKMMYEWISGNGYEPIIIATKLDKLKRSQIQKHIKMVKDGLEASSGDCGRSFFRTNQAGKGRNLGVD